MNNNSKILILFLEILTILKWMLEKEASWDTSQFIQDTWEKYSKNKLKNSANKLLNYLKLFHQTL